MLEIDTCCSLPQPRWAILDHMPGDPVEPPFISAPVCEACWIAEHHRDGAVYPPIVITGPRDRFVANVERCNRCGRPTIAGIYVRERRHA